MLDHVALHVEDLVLVASAKEHRAVLTVEGDAHAVSVDGRAVAAAPFPGSGRRGPELVGDHLGVGPLPIVVVAEASAHRLDESRVFDTEAPAQDIHEMGSVIERLAGPPAVEPVPIVVDIVVVELAHARSRSLPKVPVKFGGHGHGLAPADRRSVGGVPRLGVAHTADAPAPHLVDGGDDIGP